MNEKNKLHAFCNQLNSTNTTHPTPPHPSHTNLSIGLNVSNKPHQHIPHTPPPPKIYSTAACTSPPAASSARTFCAAFVKPMSRRDASWVA